VGPCPLRLSAKRQIDFAPSATRGAAQPRPSTSDRLRHRRSRGDDARPYQPDRAVRKPSIPDRGGHGGPARHLARRAGCLGVLRTYRCRRASGRLLATDSCPGRLPATSWASCMSNMRGSSGSRPPRPSGSGPAAWRREAKHRSSMVERSQRDAAFEPWNRDQAARLSARNDVMAGPERRLAARNAPTCGCVCAGAWMTIGCEAG
jgi:hypothetical protein